MTTYTRVQSDFKFCRCCLSRGCFKDFSLPYYWMGEKEIYEEMLYNVFNLTIPSQDSNPENIRLICELCITRLRDASNFKKQVIDSKKNFTDFLNAGRLEVKSEDPFNILKDEIKSETEDFLQDCNDDSIDDDVKLKNESLLKTKRLQTKKKKIVKEKEDERVGKKNKDVIKKIVFKDSKILERRNAALLLENSNACPFLCPHSNFACMYCIKTFIDFQQLKNHTFTEHKVNSAKILKALPRNPVKIDITSLKCKLCSESYSNTKSLREHLFRGHGKNFSDCDEGVIDFKMEKINDKYYCHICNEAFQTFFMLNRHMSGHFDNFVCEVCGRGFISESRMKTHRRIHDIGEFPCKKCDKKFVSTVKLRNHVSQVHLKKPRLKCIHCTAAFFEHESKLKHMKECHNEVFNYDCDVCHNVFHSRKLLSRHKVKHHVPKNICGLCGKSFYGKVQLMNHHVAIHTDSKDFKCLLCDKLYSTKKSLNNHMLMHKKIQS